MSKYHYEKLNLYDNNDKSTSSEDYDINNENNTDNITDIINDITNKKINKKLKIRYTYIHYTNYKFYKKTSK